MSDWGYFAAFTPTAYYLLGTAVLLAFVFLCVFIAWTYRKRQSAEYVAELLERTKPDVIEVEIGPDVDEYLVRVADAVEQLPPTHEQYTSRMPWRHA